METKVETKVGEVGEREGEVKEIEREVKETYGKNSIYYCIGIV
ncbi:MAG: hypothetical protein ACOC5T_00975 [Elusimicrobiota bacterium]